MVKPALAGLGDSHYRLAICIANRPPLDHYPQLNSIQPVMPGELAHIVANTSNHWRKVFNVYAKFIHALGGIGEPPPVRWQDYRDHYLLRAGSGVALLFSPPDFNYSAIHIIAGKTYAASLPLGGLEWLDAHFAIDKTKRVIVSPYLDYRQLTNKRIEQLAAMINAIK